MGTLAFGLKILYHHPYICLHHLIKSVVASVAIQVSSNFEI